MALSFVLHADLEPGSILQYFAIIAQVDIKAADLRHPKVPDGFGGLHDRGLRRCFPALGATADDFNHLIRAHWFLLGEWLGVKNHTGHGEAS